MLEGGIGLGTEDRAFRPSTASGWFDCVGGILLSALVLVSALVLGTRDEPEAEGKDEAMDEPEAEGYTPYPAFQKVQCSGSAYPDCSITPTRILKSAVGGVQYPGGPGYKGVPRVRALYLLAERCPTLDDYRPPPLLPSTTLSGLPYPLSGELSSGLARLTATPRKN